MQRILFVLLYVLACLCHGFAAAAPRHPPAFKTEPTFKPQGFVSLKSRPLRLDPGYLFMTPLIRDWGFGPQILTMKGELVWYGNASASYRVQDFHVCPYAGEELPGTHLCWHESPDPRHGLRPYGRKVVVDGSYRQPPGSGLNNFTVAGEDAFGETIYPNTHEFRMLNRGRSFLETVWQPKQVDLTPYGGTTDGWVLDGCLFEISVKSAEVLFSWCFLDHFQLWETYVFPFVDGQTNTTYKQVGKGTKKDPWDFLHVNAADKNEEGLYLISSRYLDQVICIAGHENALGLEPGTTLWRLGGKSNDFSKDFIFSRQHTVRFINSTSSGYSISLLDNAFEGFTQPTTPYSSAKIININNQTMVARLAMEYRHPARYLTKAQGSAQVLPNGNMLVGWGTRPQVTEFSEDGRVMYNTWLRDYSYRIFKSPWVGRPTWKPKVVSYASTCGSRTQHAYVSWNGATEVRSWRFYAAGSAKGPWSFAGETAKNGFETMRRIEPERRSWVENKMFPTGNIASFVVAEAVDARGEVLGRSAATRTFVPCRAYAAKHRCDAFGCNRPKYVDYSAAENCVASCEADAAGNSVLASLITVPVVVFLIEATACVLRMIACRSNADQVEMDASLCPSSRSTRVSEKPRAIGTEAMAHMSMVARNGSSIAVAAGCERT